MNYTYWNEGVIHSPGDRKHSLSPISLLARQVKADMVLGNAHAGCRGAGICKISVQGQRTALRMCGCEFIPVVLAYVDENSVLLTIRKKNVSFSQRAKHFHENEVSVHKTIRLPHQFHAVLGYRDRIGIDVQNIEVRQDRKSYHLLMSVSSVN